MPTFKYTLTSMSQINKLCFILYTFTFVIYQNRNVAISNAKRRNPVNICLAKLAQKVPWNVLWVRM